MNLSKLLEEFGIEVKYSEHEGFHTVYINYENISASAQAEHKGSAEISALVLFVRTLIRNKI